MGNLMTSLQLCDGCAIVGGSYQKESHKGFSLADDVAVATQGSRIKLDGQSTPHFGPLWGGYKRTNLILPNQVVVHSHRNVSRAIDSNDVFHSFPLYVVRQQRQYPPIKDKMPCEFNHRTKRSSYNILCKIYRLCHNRPLEKVWFTLITHLPPTTNRPKF